MNYLDEFLQIFINVISASWNELTYEKFTPDHEEYRADWLQANWELIVEDLLSNHLNKRIYLEAYGDGADRDGASDRITFSKQLPTHQICIKSKKNIEVKNLLDNKFITIPQNGYLFDRYVNFNDKWYDEEPVFNSVLVYNKETELVFLIDDIDFFLSKVDGELIEI